MDGVDGELGCMWGGVRGEGWVGVVVVVGGERVHSLYTLSLQEVHMALEGDDLKEVITSLPAHYTSTLNASKL